MCGVTVSPSPHVCVTGGGNGTGRDEAAHSSGGARCVFWGAEGVRGGAALAQ